MQTLAHPATYPAETPVSEPIERPAVLGVMEFLRRHGFLILLVLLFAFYLWIDLVWHAIDGRPPRWDEAHTLTISQHSYQALQRGEPLTALSLKDVSNTKPGMLPFLSALGYFIVGDSWVIATIFANGVAMLIILYVLLRAGRDFFDSAAVGAVAFLCFCNISAVLTWSGYYQTDLPLTAAVSATVCLCWVLDRRHFAGRGLLVLLALAIAIGMGIKHLYVLFVAAPLALFVCRAAFKSWRPPRIHWRGRRFLIGCLFFGIAVGVAYHWLNIHILREQIERSRNVARTGAIGPSTAIWDVFTQLISFFRPSVWCAFFAISLLWALLARRWRMLFPFLCVAGGFVGVSYVASYPMACYFLPLIPSALLVTVGVLGLPLPVPRKASKALTGLRSLFVAAVLVFLFLRYSENRLGTSNLFRVARQTPTVLASFGQWDRNPLVDNDYWLPAPLDGNATTLPYPGAWAVDEFMQVIVDKLKGPPPGQPYVLLYCTGGFEWMTDEFARYQIKKLRLGDRLHMSQIFEVPEGKTPGQIVADYDFVILKTGKTMKLDFFYAPWGPGFQRFINGLTDHQYAGLKAAGFELLQLRSLPDGSEGSLWRSRRK